MAAGKSIVARPLRPPRAGVPVGVLHASNNPADQRMLQTILRHTNWLLFQADSAEEARKALNSQNVSVIICDYEFCSTHWKKWFDEFCTGSASPSFVVSSYLATDDVWAEALNLGAEEVLATPFEPKEVHWVVSHLHLAWLNAKAAGKLRPSAGAGPM